MELNDEDFLASVCGERDDACRRVVLLENVINRLATNELTLHFGAEGWFYKIHPRNIRSDRNFETALEAVAASQAEMGS